MAYTQEKRKLRVKTELGDDVLLLAGFSGVESVSAPFSYALDLLSEKASIKPDEILRTKATITIALPGDKNRHIHGMINRFTQLGQADDLVEYRAEFVPWLWFLSLSSDCRIYQELTVPEIAEKVFKDQGYSDFKIECKGEYEKRDFCVQYRETHLNFVSRLLEEEGIFYFFRHSDSKHELVLADEVDSIKKCPVQSTADLLPQGGLGGQADVVTAIEREYTAHVGTVTLRDYDFKQPSTLLEGTVSGDGVEEVYDYPGMFTKPGVGERFALTQLEEQEEWYEVIRGESACRSFQSGFSFDLAGHYSDDVNKEYKLLMVRHSARAEGYRGASPNPFQYRNDFTAIKRDVPYRPPRTTPKPVVQGSQTALVVGPKGAEIHVDEFARVKVQFYWDRVGKKDDGSSCWIRVASVWAGKNWGFIQIPRIGQEVLVDFLEGDPDLPIITGRVYNAEQKPPYDLPANKTQSGVQSRSSPDGTADNFNEIRFEDKKGEEHVYIHAEKDKMVVVENDRTETVGHDEMITIENDRTEEVKNDETITIGNNRTEDVGKDESITIGENRTESVGKDETITIQGNRVESVEKDERITIAGKRTESVEKDEVVTVANNRAHDVGKNDTQSIGKKLMIDAGDEIVLKSGNASIVLKKNGDIKLAGKNIDLEGSGKINIKASSDVKVKGSKVTLN